MKFDIYQLMSGPAVIKREGCCRPCAHSIRHPTRFGGRKVFCQKLFNGDYKDIKQVANLTANVTRDPNLECPIGCFAKATPDELRKPDDPIYIGLPFDGMKDYLFKLWGKIHKVEDPTEAWWTKEILKKLPCCNCVTHAEDYRRKNPAPFGNLAEFRMWAWGFHNAVNSLPEVNHPQLSWEDCSKLYNY